MQKGVGNWVTSIQFFSTTTREQDTIFSCTALAKEPDTTPSLPVLLSEVGLFIIIIILSTYIMLLH